VFARWLILVSFVTSSFAATPERVTSQSQQFVVYSSGNAVRVGRIPAGAVEVVPEFLVVTAERVKQAVIAEIPALAQARTTVNVRLLDSGDADTTIGIISSRFADGWKYEMAVPRVAEEARLVKGFINVLLLQYANRNSERNAELPAWLTEGLAEELLYTVGPVLVIGRNPTSWEASTRDMLQWTRETLRTNSAPSFQELTTAAVPARKSAGESIYLASSHLLVHALLEMPNGRQRFAKFLQNLPRTWNWQTAFMQAFEFQRMLDVEKWWSLTVIEFTSRDQRQAWSQAVSLRRLDEALRVRVEYRAATNALPETRLVDLKMVLEEDDATLQRQALEEILNQLRSTAPYMAAQVAGAATSYQKTIETYLQKRAGRNVTPGLRTTSAAQSESLKAETLRRLATLDEQCRAMAERIVTSAR
jgi:hypothetical protein